MLRGEQVRALNETAAARLAGTYELSIVPGATHLFEEAGALEEVARRASAWFRQEDAAGRRVMTEHVRDMRALA